MTKLSEASSEGEIICKVTRPSKTKIVVGKNGSCKIQSEGGEDLEEIGEDSKSEAPAFTPKKGIRSVATISPTSVSLGAAPSIPTISVASYRASTLIKENAREISGEDLELCKIICCPCLVFKAKHQDQSPITENNIFLLGCSLAEEDLEQLCPHKQELADHEQGVFDMLVKDVGSTAALKVVYKLREQKSLSHAIPKRSGLKRETSKAVDQTP